MTAAAWSVPSLALVSAAPAFAASRLPLCGGTTAPLVTANYSLQNSTSSPSKLSNAMNPGIRTVKATAAVSSANVTSGFTTSPVNGTTWKSGAQDPRYANSTNGAVYGEISKYNGKKIILLGIQSDGDKGDVVVTHTFSSPVYNPTFSVTDIDWANETAGLQHPNNYQDRVVVSTTSNATITATAVNSTTVPVSGSGTKSTTALAAYGVAADNNLEWGSTAGVVNHQFNGMVSSFTLVYGSALANSTGGQIIPLPPSSSTRRSAARPEPMTDAPRAVESAFSTPPLPPPAQPPPPAPDTKPSQWVALQPSE